MEYLEFLVNNLDMIYLLFVPGYIMINLYSFMNDYHFELSKVKVINSIIISYFLKQIIEQLQLTSKSHIIIVSTIIAILISIVGHAVINARMLRSVRIFIKNMLKIRLTYNKQIIEDVIPDGGTIEAYSEKNNIFIEGDVEQFNEVVDGKQYVVITKYKIYSLKNHIKGTLLDNSDDKSLVINLYDFELHTYCGFDNENSEVENA